MKISYQLPLKYTQDKLIKLFLPLPSTKSQIMYKLHWLII